MATLEEIDRQQREQENEQSQSGQSTAFAQPMIEALDTTPGKIATPLLEQEEIEDQEPPRINLTAVVCTAIVAFCATLILLIAHPWRDNSQPIAEAIPAEAEAVQQTDAANSQSAAKQQQQGKAETEAKQQADNKAAQADAAQQTQSKPEQPAATKPEQPKANTVQPAASTLPVVKVTKTGTNNPYNSIRLIDASSRILTKAEVEQMTKAELALARNAIFARHGYQFNNPELKEFFAKQSWFKPTDVTTDAIPFTQTELDNIRLIKAQENK